MPIAHNKQQRGQQQAGYRVNRYFTVGLTLMAAMGTYVAVRSRGVLPSWMDWAGAEVTEPAFGEGLALSTSELISEQWTDVIPETALTDEPEWADLAESGDLSLTDTPLPTSVNPEAHPVAREAAALPPRSRRQLQSNHTSNVTVINPMPDQIVEPGVEYRYRLDGREIFSGEFDKINVSVPPDWLRLEWDVLAVIGSTDTPDRASGVAVSGSLALVADGESGLQLIDISTPSAPVLIGSVDTSDYAWGVAVSGSLALVADGNSGLQVIDISTPSAPILVGSYDTPGYAADVAVSGSLALVADYTSGLQVINISTPSAPILQGNHTLDRAYGVVVSGSLALVADGNSGLQVIDISTPSAPIVVGSTNTPGFAHGVAVSGSLALVADGNSGLQVIDISTPSAPVLIGSVDTSGYARGVAVSGSLALVADGLSGLQVIDISTPSAPVLIGSVDTSDYAWGVVVSGLLALVADYDSGLQVIDYLPDALALVGYPPGVLLGQETSIVLSAWSNGLLVALDQFVLTIDRLPQRVDTSLTTQSQFPGTIHGLLLDADRLFDDADGHLLRLECVQAGEELVRPVWLTLSLKFGVTALDTPGYVADVAVSGSLTLVANDLSGLQVIDISTPSAPTLVGSIDTPGRASGVAVSDSLALVADGLSGLQVIDISTPSNPILLGSYDTSGRAQGVAVSDSLALMADGDSGLQLIDISTPSALILVGSYDTPGNAVGVAVSGSLALVADGLSGLQLIDISTPSAPILVGGYDIPDQAWGVAISGSLALVADYNSGLQVIDISTPSAPIVVGSVDTPGAVWGVAVSGALALVADGFSGLQLIDISTPSAPILVGSTDTPDWAHGVTVSGSLALVADGESGLQIIDLSQYQLTGSPGPEDAGNYELLLTATDPLGGQASDTFTWRVEGPPVLQGSIAPQFHKVGQAFSYFIPQGLVTDPNLDLIRFSARLLNNQPLPDWLGFDGISATFFGVPQSSDAGNYTLEILATDNIAGSTRIAFTLFVDHTPTLNRPIAQQVAGVGLPYDFPLPADTFIDQDQDVLLFDATRSSGAALPSWLHFDASSQRFYGTPDASHVGAAELRLSVHDPFQGHAFAEFPLVVEYFPQASQTIVAPVAGVGQAFLLSLAPDSFVDADDALLSLSALQSSGDSLPSWLSFNPATTTFSGIPNAAAAGILALRVTATDRYGASAISDFDLRITHVPAVQTPIPNQIIPIGSPYFYSILSNTITDGDGDPLTYTLATQDASALPHWLHFNASDLTLSGNPNVTLTHSYPLNLMASDPYGLSTHAAFQLSLDHFPELMGPLTPPVAGVGERLQWTLPEGAFVDEDGDVLSYQLERVDGTSAPKWLTLQSQTRLLSGTPSAVDLGVIPLRIVASDPLGAQAIGTLDLRVVYAPKAVQSIVTPPTAREGRLVEVSIPPTTFEDLDDTVLTYSAVFNGDKPLPSWLQFDADTITFSGIPQSLAVGSHALSVIATDPTGGQARAEFILTVDPNFPPEVQTPITNQVAEVLSDYRFFIPPDTIIDRNQDPLTFSVTGIDGASLPNWLKFDPTERQLYGTPSRRDVQDFGITEFGVTVTARDDRASVSTDFKMTVEGKSTIQMLIYIGAPLVTVFTTLLAAYKLRAMCLNRYKPERYEKIQEHLVVGEHFKRALETPQEKIERIHVKLPKTDSEGYCAGFFKQCRTRHRDLPGGRDLPTWMEYDLENNTLHSKGPVPELTDPVMIVTVEGAAGIVLEQFELKAASHAAGLHGDELRALETGRVGIEMAMTSS